jgi:triphosphatase
MARSISPETRPDTPRTTGVGSVGMPKRLLRKNQAPKAPHAPRTMKAAAKTIHTKRPAWTKALPIQLAPDTTVDAAIAAVMAACHTHWQTNLAAAIDGRQPEGTHQVRVGLRRLRSALSVFKKYIPATQRAALNAEAKWLLTQLGTARDLDVFIDSLSAPLTQRVSEDAGLAQLIRAARAAQGKAHTAAAKALRSARAVRFAARLDAWITGHGWRVGHDDADTARDGRKLRAADFAQRFINRRMRNIRADYADIEKLTVPERHELRLAIKKTRYGLEFFQSVLPVKRARLLATTLKNLQDNLGHLNDIAVAERTVTMLVNMGATGTARRQIAAGGARVSAWHKDLAATAEPEMVKLWRKMKKTPAL